MRRNEHRLTLTTETASRRFALRHLPLYVRCLFAAAALFGFCLTSNDVSAGDADCLACHKSLAEAKVVHPAVQMGCTACHTAVDASDVPHKMKNNIPKGLSAAQPELCFGCHDDKRLKKKVIHPAVQMGCTVCHNPHSSKNAKLLKAELPDLCFNCHDKKKFVDKFVHAPVGIGMCTSCHSPHQSDREKLLVSAPPELCHTCHDKAAFTKKNVHPPVAAGMCLSCHAPHVAPETALLMKEPVQVCLTCHADVRKREHAIAGLSGEGHPIGLSLKKKKDIGDPARPGKKFYCGSCHDPHSSDSIHLFRYPASSPMELCSHCHKM